MNGTYEYKLLYSGQLSPIARLNDEDRVVEEYVYGSRVNVPEYMIKDGRKYRFITDHRGSVRMVVDTHTGEVVQETEYCEFGMIISETLANGWEPVIFGYAGGLQDRDTGLIRFGARDYDPMVGRWTSKEPLGFNGSSNFYVYAENDPVNYVDPDGNLAWFIPLIGGTAGGIMGGVAAYYSGQDFWGVARSASVGFFAGALSTIPIPGARMWLGSAFSGMVTSMGANIFLQYLEDDPCEENYDWDSVFRSGIAGAVGGSIGGKLASFPGQKIPHAVMIKELRNGLPLFTENASDAISSTVGGFAGGITDTALQK